MSSTVLPSFHAGRTLTSTLNSAFKQHVRWTNLGFSVYFRNVGFTLSLAFTEQVPSPLVTLG